MMRKAFSRLSMAFAIAFTGLTSIAHASLPDPDGKEANMKKPVQVYILMGQSNMLGFGKIKGGEGSLEHATKEKGLYPYLIDDSGNWTTRKDVRYVRVMQNRGKMQLLNNEWMTIKGNIGPEMGIGHFVGHHTDAPVMILKSCIGNRGLGWDLLPPGSPRRTHNGKEYPAYKETYAGKKDKTIVKYEKGGKMLQWYAGKQYDDDVANAKKVLSELDKHYPGAKGYEVAGFFWWQGARDAGDAGHSANYEKNLDQLVKALRKDFNAPKARFVFASLGQTKKGSKSNDGLILNAMESVAKKLKGDGAFVYTNPISKGGSANGHYNKHAETYHNVGEAMGKAMVSLLK